MTELPNRETFDNAHRAYVEARAAYDAFCEANPTNNMTSEQAEPIEKQSDALCETMTDAAIALATTPAPDADAVSAKWAAIKREESWNLIDKHCSEIMRTLAQDAIRLAATSGTGEFERTLAEWREKQDRLEAYRGDAGPDEDALIAEFREVDDRLIAMPVVNVHQLRAKAEVIWNNATDLPAMDDMRSLFADLRRLAPGESPTFNAARWLAWWERNSGGWIVRDDEVILIAPNSENGTDALWELDTRGGTGAVKALIRERQNKALAA